jgi:hypothetical protein
MDNIGAVPVNLWGAVILVIEIQDHIQCIFIAGYLQKFLLMVVLSIEKDAANTRIIWIMIYLRMILNKNDMYPYVSQIIPNQDIIPI